MSMTYTEELTVTHCWCGIAVAIPANLYTTAHRRKHDVYCPLGHTFVFGDTLADQLREERHRHAATRELLEAEERARLAEERSHAQTRGQLRKTRERVAAGVCPFCHRTFSQLARHMKSKHPGEIPATELARYEEAGHAEPEHAHARDPEQAILDHLREHGATRFGALRDALGLSSSRASYLLAQLVGRGEIERYLHGVYRLPK
jgi:hypothetical protein